MDFYLRSVNIDEKQEKTRFSGCITQREGVILRLDI